MKKRNEVWITPKEEAQIRLSRWGKVIRSLPYGGNIPNSVPYRIQSFMVDRVDNDRIMGRIVRTEQFDEALEVDGWMDQIKEVAPNHYMAGIIVYVLYPWKNQFEKRLIEWKKETGLIGQTRFYECLNALERDISFQIGLTEAFKSS